MIGGIFGPSVRDQVIGRAFAPDTKPEPKKPGFFGKGGAGRGIAGTIGDFLLQNSGFQPIYAPAMQSQRLLAAQQQLAESQRAAEMQDWRAKYDYERANPKPTTNDTVADFDFIRKNLGDEAAADFLRNKANPPVYRLGADGQFYRVDTEEPRILGESLPEGWVIQEPAQSTGGNFMTSGQYQAIVDAKGPQAAEAWRRKYGIEVR